MNIKIIITCLLIPISCEADVIVTKSGPIQGITTKGFSGKDVHTYYGIPYAEPPTGNLRFSAPRLVTPWTKVFNASRKPCPCMQKISPKLEERLEAGKVMIERPWCEDCLTLNIWVPIIQNPKNLPVMVYFHGGAFQLGSSRHFWAEGHTLAAEEELIVVSVNYRLDVFGFLKLPVPGAPGNVGLLDQQLSLQWLQDNVARFGGDPNRVTIYGTSAGGASVGFHLLAPSSRGLFKRAISMSGVPNNIWSIRDASLAVQKSLDHAKSLNCSNSDPSLVLECLRSLSPDELLGEHNQIMNPATTFGPTVDGSFITENPSVSIPSGRFNDADVIMGCVSDEGKFLISMAGEGIMNKEDQSLPLARFSQLLSNAMPHFSSSEREAIKAFYIDMNGVEDPRDLRDQCSLLMGDFHFVCDINDFSYRYALTGNKVYRYVFDQSFPQPGVPSWGGADHGTDMVYFSGLALMPRPAGTATDMETNSIPGSSETPNPGAVLSRTMMKHLGNFARTGDPNVADQPNWPLYTPWKRQHLRMALNSTVDAYFRAKECSFWNLLLPLTRSRKTSC